MQKQLLWCAVLGIPTLSRAILALICLIFAINLPVFAQSYSETRQFVGSGSAIGSKVLTLSDGSLLSAGSIGNNNDMTKGDILVIKSTSEGQTIWSKRYTSQPFKGSALCQNTVPRLEFAADAVEVADGYVLAGCYDHFEQAPPFNCNPNNHLGVPLLWEQTASRFDYLVMKIGKDGDLKWTKRYGDGKSQVATTIEKARDGGFMVSGFTTGEWLLKGEPYRPFFLKLDANGNVQWTKVLDNFDQEGSALIVPTAHKAPIVQLADGTWLLAASTGSSTRMAKLDAAGTVIWSKCFDHGGAASQIGKDWGVGAFSAAYIHTLLPMPNGNVGMIGSFMFGSALIAPTNPPQAFSLFANAGWYIEVSTAGQLVRQSVFSRPNPAFGTSNNTVAFDFTPTDAQVLPNGHLAIAGLHSYASVLLEYDPAATNDKKIAWAKQFDTWNYSLIPLSYDLPSCAIANGNAFLMTDNFKLGRTNTTALADGCHIPQKMAALDLSPMPISSCPLQFSQMNQSANVTFTATNHAVSASKPCATLLQRSQVATTLSDDIRIAPSPLTGHSLTVWMDAPESGNYTSTFFDQAGRVVYRMEQPLESGPNQLTLETLMQNGLYFLEIKAENGYRKVVKVVKAGE